MLYESSVVKVSVIINQEPKMKKLLLCCAILTLPFTTSAHAATVTALGDLAAYSVIIADVQKISSTGDFKAAKKRIKDFETKWDVEHTKIRPLNADLWGHIDDAADAALQAVREAKPVAAKVKTTLATLVAELDNPNLVPPAN
jgi:hypothetical protein